jgi:hypothetical protein
MARTFKFLVGYCTVELHLDSIQCLKARARGWVKLAYDRLFGCPHPPGYREQGPRTPLLYGSAATEVCSLCGKYRYDHHGWSDWEPGPVPTERDEEM